MDRTEGCEEKGEVTQWCEKKEERRGGEQEEVTLSLTINETLKQLSSLPILMQNYSAGNSIALGKISLFPYHLDLRSLPAPLRGQLGVKQVL